jgi:hypothetical protein
MPYAPQYAFADMQQPEVWGTCDRCGFLYFLKDLLPQMQWAGQALVNTGLLVCARECLDNPNEQFRTIIIGPDPAPVLNARPGFQTSQSNQGGSDTSVADSGWGLGQWSGGEWSIGDGPDFAEV